MSSVPQMDPPAAVREHAHRGEKETFTATGTSHDFPEACVAAWTQLAAFLGTDELREWELKITESVAKGLGVLAWTAQFEHE